MTAWCVVCGWPPVRTTHHPPRLCLSSHPEQLEPSLVTLHDPVAIRRMLRLRERRIPGDDFARRPASGLEQRQVGREVRIAQRHAARLACAGQLAHAPLLE